MDAEKLERLESELIRRTLAGSVGRGGKVIQRPTNAQTGQFANFVASCLLDLNRKVDKLEKRKASPYFFIKFAKFRKNFIKKVNNNPLIFGTLVVILAHAALEFLTFKRFYANGK